MWEQSCAAPSDIITDYTDYRLQKLAEAGSLAFIEGSLEVKLPTVWTDEKQRWAEAERREE
jgi:hypothetical protein